MFVRLTTINISMRQRRKPDIFILVFARLSLVGAQDVVEFLAQIEINGQNGLQVVLSKWLENSINFAGYDEIRQKYDIFLNC